MNIKNVILTLLTSAFFSGAAIANEHNNPSAAFDSESTPQLVKKLRADASRLPVGQLLNKYIKQNSKQNTPFSASSALSLIGADHQPGQQAGR